ncbi:glycosyl transferase [Salmonella enterica subsp. diarizonae]|nr:glycosyl transferase [Salmonella enterica subsp. diarizonae]ECQ1026014.1 glycosyl transferase [Salmonella enterica subsp. diarizonae]EDE1924261.1 glycosyl transferase [Salmonella enterica subsp. diarizonae]
MNKLSYYLKYAEYLLRKYRTILTPDYSFHTNRLNKISGGVSDLKNPVTLSEKICHRILFDHNNLYTLLADKLAVREYVHSKTRQVKTIPIIGIYSRVSDIDFSKLPEKFVLKCNHDSGSTEICTNRQNFNTTTALNRLKLALKKNMYYTTREWQYKHIPPVILCEQYIDLFSNIDKNTTPEMLRIHCFHGVACFVEADFSDNNGNNFINVYDCSWELQPFQMEYPNTPYKISEPALFHKAIIASQELASEINYCRVDLMLHKDEVYFSELTLSPRRGKLNITPSSWDAKLGGMWNLTSGKSRCV